MLRQTVRHRARRGRSADVSAVRPVRPRPRHDGRSFPRWTRPGRRRSIRRKIIDAIRYFGVTNLFGSPALIHRVGRYGVAHGVQLPTLRRVISAGAPVPAAGDRALRRDARRRRAGPYALRGDRSAAGRLDRQRRDPRRDAAAHRRRRRRLRRPAGRGHDASRSSASATSRSRPGATISNCRAGEIGEIVVQGPVVTRVLLQSPRSDRAGQDRRSRRRRFLASHGRSRLPRRARPALVLRPQVAARRHARTERCSRSPARAFSTPIRRCYRTALVGVRRNGDDASRCCASSATRTRHR